MGTDRTDRILLGACAVIWLAALGAGVAATVALVDLGRGHPEATGDSDTPWLLYTVIAVSALVIAGAIPLLLRARAMGDRGPARGPIGRDRGGDVPARGGFDPAVSRPRVIGNAAEPSERGSARQPSPTVIRPSAPTASDAVVDQIWLRCSAALGCAIGAGATAIGVATNLMAVESDTGAWVLYGLTGLIIVAMPVIPVAYLRILRQVTDSSAY